MTHHDDLDRQLVTWFTADAARQIPSGLLGAIEATSRARRQQPGWLVTLRGESMGRTAFRNIPVRRLALVVAVVSVLVLVAVLIAGRQQPTRLHTGLLAFVRNGDVYLAGADGSNARIALSEDGVSFGAVSWSPDGARLAIGGSSGAVLLTVATGQADFVGGSNPVWSPDGGRLAVLDPSSTSSVDAVLRIVDVPALSTLKAYPVQMIGGLAWSPNGRWIAANGGDAGNAVLRIDVATGEVVEIDKTSGHLDSPRKVRWSPDSAHVAFVRYEDPASESCGEFVSCHVDVFVADADGSNAVRVNGTHGRGDGPIWSPDGAWLAFRAIASTGGKLAASGIHVVQPDGTDERNVVSRPVRAFAWRPESDTLVFTVDDGGSVDSIWETSLGGDARPLNIQIDATDDAFAWQQIPVDWGIPALPSLAAILPSATLELVTPVPAAPADPSTTWPALALDGQANCDPVILKTASAMTTALADHCTDNFSSYSGSWSPTGRFYVFGHSVAGGTWDVDVLRPDGTAAFQLSAPSGGGTVWAPDGSRFGFVVDGDVMIVRQEGGGAWSAAKVSVGGALDLAWSPDGQSLAVATSDGTVQVGDGNGADLHAIGSFPLPIRWAPDGSHLLFVRDGNAWVVSADGSQQRNVSNLPLGGAIDASWSPDGTWIAVAAATGLVLTTPDGTSRRSLDFGSDGYGYDSLAWSPNAATLAVGIAGASQRVLLISVDRSAIVRIDDAEAPVWSPDGQFLLVVALGGSGNQPTRSVAVMNADGSGRHDLVSLPDLGQMVWVR